MRHFLADLRGGLRQLGRARAVTALALLALALSIGAGTAVFGLVRAALLRPLPYAAPERLVVLWDARDRGETTWLSAREVVSYQAEAATLASVAAYSAAGANLTGGDAPARVIVGTVTPNAFATLGVAPLLGRSLRADEGVEGADGVAVLGHDLWQRRFGGAPDVVGRTVEVNGRARTVVGVMPPGFRLPLDFREERPSELWVPLTIDRADPGAWGDRGLTAFARLQPGVAPARATEELALVARRWIAAGFVRDVGNGRLFRAAVPVADLVLGEVRQPLLVLLGAVGLIILIACANVANLLLARADARRREIAVRTALGAARARLVRQLLTESVLLAAIGGALGALVAWGGTRALVALAPAELPRLREAGVDGGVLLFALFLTLATGVLAGLLPALRLSRTSPAAVLAEGGRGGTAGRARQRARHALAVAQLALSVVLLVGAALLGRSLLALRQVELGFTPAGALTARVALPQAHYPTPESVVAFYDRLLAQVAALPGVERAAATRLLPLTGTIGDWSITIEGRTAAPGENPNGDWQVVTPGYFEAMGMRPVRGRVPNANDDADAPLVAVVNETMAERYWPGVDPIGRRFHLGTADQPWVTIVGIVGAVRHNAIVEEPRAEMYLTHAQFMAETGNAPRALTLVVRAAGTDPLALAAPLRAAVRALDPRLPVDDVLTLQQVTDRALAGPRFTATLLGAFALVALLLAAVGVYGVVSLLVAQRRRELGIRLALGARRGAVARLVLARGLALATGGVALGVAGALLLGRVLESLVYGVTTRDPATFAAVPLLLSLVALLACVVPALRAAAVDPAITLREE